MKIYTDGACSGNPGVGGWAAIIITPQQEIQEISGYEIYTTNNRMELIAVISALKYIDTVIDIEIFTDSKYVKNGITDWIDNWSKNNWKTASKQSVKNRDLWEELHSRTKLTKIKWSWIKGHAGDKYNEMADKAATKQVQTAKLIKQQNQS